MPTTWDDLSRDEQETMKRLGHGGAATLMLTIAQVDALRSRGLIEQKLGGPGLNREGKRLYDEYVARMRRARG